MNEINKYRKKPRKGLNMHLEAFITSSSISYVKKQIKESDWISSNGSKIVFILREIQNIKLWRKKMKGRS